MIVRQFPNHTDLLGNYMQDYYGNLLPQEAADMLVELIIKVGKTAKEGNTFETQEAHQKYMVDTIEPFLKGGSSYAPKFMHWLGVFVQGPAILWNPMSVWDKPQSAIERLESISKKFD